MSSPSQISVAQHQAPCRGLRPVPELHLTSNSCSSLAPSIKMMKALHRENSVDFWAHSDSLCFWLVLWFAAVPSNTGHQEAFICGMGFQFLESCTTCYCGGMCTCLLLQVVHQWVADLHRLFQQSLLHHSHLPGSCLEVRYCPHHLSAPGSASMVQGLTEKPP